MRDPGIEAWYNHQGDHRIPSSESDTQTRGFQDEGDGSVGVRSKGEEKRDKKRLKKRKRQRERLPFPLTPYRCLFRHPRRHFQKGPANEGAPCPLPARSSSPESSQLYVVKVSRSVMSHSLRPHGLQPARLLYAGNSPGKNTGVGLPFPSPGDLPHPGVKRWSPTLQAEPLPTEPPGKLPHRNLSLQPVPSGLLSPAGK